MVFNVLRSKVDDSKVPGIPTPAYILKYSSIRTSIRTRVLEYSEFPVQKRNKKQGFVGYGYLRTPCKLDTRY